MVPGHTMAEDPGPGLALHRTQQLCLGPRRRTRHFKRQRRRRRYDCALCSCACARPGASSAWPDNSFPQRGPSLPAYSVECGDRFADERGPVRALPSPPSNHCVRVVTKKSRGPRCRAQTGHLYSNRAPCACRGHRTQRLRPVPGPIAAAGSSGICFAALPKRATRPRRAPQCRRRRARACGLPWLVPSWRGTYCSEGVGKGCGTGPFGVPRAFAPERILDARRRQKSAVAPAGSPAPVGRRCVVWAALVPNSHPNEFGLPSRVGSGAP